MANGLRLAYDEFGKSNDPAIVLIMGLGTQMVAWPEPFCIALAERGYRVIRFDNRDIGLSQKIEVKKDVNILKLLFRKRIGLSLRVPYTLRDMAADTIGLLDHLEIDAAHWVGASMGGMIAQILAAEYPQRSLSLTSIMSTTGNPELPQTNWRVSKQLISRPSNNDETAYLKHSLETWKVIGSPDYPPNQDELTDRILSAVRRSYYPKGYKNQMAAILEGGDRRGLLRKISVPTMVIHGKADVLVPVEGGIDTAANIKDAKLELIEGMGHDLPKQLLPKFIDLISANAQLANN
ncbi:pimeloyl-ACP methyl ester carboxylesterase [Arenicella xantha]|uniref:Pimeloyl-ACP methyl ester carboxylesterase n=2 Tax=Arenicella xantha TaxID=644221 RepID=A0A395JJT9_9GAMM|nr:pimeloyl-ACP methyl ester carboxylesterase [Arenicella xantha]